VLDLFIDVLFSLPEPFGTLFLLSISNILRAMGALLWLSNATPFGHYVVKRLLIDYDILAS